MRHEAIRRWTVTTITVFSLGQTTMGQTPPPRPSNREGTRLKTASTDIPWTRIHIKDGFTVDAARRALRGAVERLAKPGCQVIFSEFQDGRGLPLSDRLVELGASPEDYLRLVIFQDGGASRQCGKPGVLAFTTRNSRIVYLCGRDFERAEHRDPRETQVTIIHEMLHSLGLGENPPSPRDISRRILKRCA